MAAPTVKVFVGFQTTTGFGQPFQLNDAVYGKLNTGTLGGLAFAELTNIVMSVNIQRGRSRQMDQFNAGSCSVVFNNDSRILDPSNTASIYYPYVTPRCLIIVTANDIPIFTGLVKDWNLEYQNANNSTMVAVCSDQFTVLANINMDTFTPSAQLSGARINTVLDRPDVAYQGQRFIATGNSALGAFAVTQGINCLNYLQLCTTSEQGYLFMSAAGTLTFKGRTDVLNPVAAVAFTDPSTGTYPYMTLDSQYGDELLYNYVATQSPAGAVQIAQDATSIAAYQASNYSMLDLLNSTTTEVAGIGNYYMNKYKDPTIRFTGVSCLLNGYTTAAQNAVLALDMTSIASVLKTFVTGTPLTVTQNLVVTGVNHRITPQNHLVSFVFENTDQGAFFVLDSALFGILNQNQLAF